MSDGIDPPAKRRSVGLFVLIDLSEDFHERVLRSIGSQFRTPQPLIAIPQDPGAVSLKQGSKVPRLARLLEARHQVLIAFHLWLGPNPSVRFHNRSANPKSTLT